MRKVSRALSPPPSPPRSQALEQIAAACPTLIRPLAVAPCGHCLPQELPDWTASFVSQALADMLQAAEGSRL